MIPNKQALLISFDFPPSSGNAGLQRSLAFNHYFSEFGWHSDILTVSAKAHAYTSDEFLHLVSKSTKVIQAFCLNSATHLSFKGKYPLFLAIPDRWQSWVISGVISGLKQINSKKPAVIISTYPIATAHLIGYILHKLTGIPWVADFRDPMAQENYPSNPWVKKAFTFIEKKALKHSCLALFTSPSCKLYYQKKYPNINSSKYHLLYNGFFEEFHNTRSASKISSQEFIFLHSGILDLEDRNPSQIFHAVKQLNETYPSLLKQVKFVFRGAGNEYFFNNLCKELQIEHLVVFKPKVNFNAALDEIYQSSHLFLMQGSSCNAQIPSKLFEYIAARKPIIALADKQGDTYRLLKDLDLGAFGDINSIESIAELLFNVLTEKLTINTQSDRIDDFTRRSQTRKLVELIETKV